MVLKLDSSVGAERNIGCRLHLLTPVPQIPRAQILVSPVWPRENHDPKEVQVSTLLSIKTGGCPEDCAYCPQASRYHTDIKKNDLMFLISLVHQNQLYLSPFFILSKICSAAFVSAILLVEPLPTAFSPDPNNTSTQKFGS